MLAIEVALLTGRYVATAYNNRRESEWPPHPARLYSAFAATHFGAEDRSERLDERAVLEWIEQQGPPAIVASEAAHRDVMTVFVPVNDVALTNVDEEAERLSEAQAALVKAQASGGRAVAKCTGEVRKAQAALEKAVGVATSVPTKSLNPRYGQRVLPEYRVRQPRTFPSVTPADPRVVYIWAAADPTEAQREALDGLLKRVVRVGHSSSLVALRLVDNPGQPTWHPTIDGEAILRIVQPGQLAALESAFERHRETEPRVMPALPQSYTCCVQRAVPSAHASTFSDQWIVFRRTEGPLLPMTAAAGVARAMRRTLMSFADEPIPELLSGHRPDGAPSHTHLAIVPLPFIGHPHATGAIIGFALVFPAILDAEVRRAVYRAVGRWEERYRQEDEDTPVVQLNLGASGALRLERVEWGSVPATLQSKTWCGAASVWLSATPVALDRNPGDLHSRDSRRLARAVEEAAESLSDACERIDLPRPRRVEILPAPPFAGAAKAQHYQPYPAELDRIRRVLTHARLEFDNHVRGPVLLGAGRYAGLGLFKPVLPRG